jgi:hypothetical protein
VLYQLSYRATGERGDYRTGRARLDRVVGIQLEGRLFLARPLPVSDRQEGPQACRGSGNCSIRSGHWVGALAESDGGIGGIRVARSGWHRLLPFDDPSSSDGDVLDGAVFRAPTTDLVGGRIGDRIHELHSADDPPDRRIASVEVAVIRLENEELAAIRVLPAAVGERDDAALEGGSAELVGKIGERSALSVVRRILIARIGVSALDHETPDDPVEGRSVVLPLSREATQPGDAFGGEVGHELDLDRAGSVVAGDLELQQERSRVARPLESDGVLARGVARIRAGLSAPSRSPRVVPRDRASRQGSDQEQATGNRSQFVGEVGRSSERATARTGGCRGRSLGDGAPPSSSFWASDCDSLRRMGHASSRSTGVLSRLMGAGRRLEGAVDVAFVMRSRGRGLESALLALVLCVGMSGRDARADGGFRPPTASRQGMVVSSHHAAARAGASILSRGGNAVDAAVATAFAVGVAQPFSAGVGGGAFALLRLPDGTFAALDAREVAPSEAKSTMFVDAGVDDDASVLGPLAVAVPAFVPGMVELLEKHGTMTLAEVLEPAIGLAEGGVEIGAYHAGMAGFMRSRLSREEFAETWRIQFAPFDPASMKGQRLVQRDLAATLRRLAAGGERVFRDGVVGRAIVAEVRRRGGLLTIEDMRRYEPVWRQPIVSEYRALRIVSFPPPSSGGAVLAQALNVLDGFDLAERTAGEAASVHPSLRRP